MIRAIIAIAALLLSLALGGCRTAKTDAQLRASTDAQLRTEWLEVGAYRPPQWFAIDKGTWPDVFAYRKAVRREALSGAREPNMTKEFRKLIDAEVPVEGMPTEFIWWMWGPPYQKSKSDSPYGQVERWVWNGSPTIREVTFRDGKVLWWSDTTRR